MSRSDIALHLAKAFPHLARLAIHLWGGSYMLCPNASTGSLTGFARIRGYVSGKRSAS